jgi:glycosyltransferase involved in cell wall biosynthesis
MFARRKKILFLTLRTFSLTGGIEKMSRSVAFALHQIGQEGHCRVKTFSIYDADADLDRRYLPPAHFRGFGGNKLMFIISALFYGVKCGKVILSHVNLMPAAFVIKLISPRTRIILFAHGIELWRPIRGWERRFIRNKCQQVWAVSQYTAKCIERMHGFHPSFIQVLNNCIDPFFSPPANFTKPQDLSCKFGFDDDQPVLLTLTRLSSTEAYKGYNLVIECLPELITRYPRIRYLIAGKADEVEHKRLRKLISEKNLDDHVFLTGFIPEAELSAIFRLADIFIMPSKKEGFGIVFIEAAVCGCRIIAGNHDGSSDALLNGKLGKLIDPDNKREMVSSILELLENPKPDDYARFIQSLSMSTFGFENYIEQVKELISCE